MGLMGSMMHNCKSAAAGCILRRSETAGRAVNVRLNPHMLVPEAHQKPQLAKGGSCSTSSESCAG
jgi:hypothetical protein